MLDTAEHLFESIPLNIIKIKKYGKAHNMSEVRLRKLKIEDADNMLEWMHDEEIQRNFRMNTLHKTKQDVMEFISDSTIVAVNGGSIHFAITDEEDEYLGTISLKEIDLQAHNAEYAICLRKKAQGQGIAKAATKLILEEAFDKLELERVYLNVLSENERAIKLYQSCGFQYEGEFRKHLFLRGKYRNLKWFAILKDEYKAKYCN